MELKEFENIWKEQDKKITNSISLNKEILKRMLIAKPEKRINWIKIKAGFNILSPIILPLLLMIMKVQFHITTQFYVGLSIFLIIYLTIYIWDVKYFLLIRKIDFSDSILVIKKNLAILEKYVIKKTRFMYILMPLAIIGIFLMLIQKPVFNRESIIVFILIALVFISSLYYTFKYSVYERFKILNKEIQEVENIDS
ncbi:MAG: hypothetical protein PHF48_02605 [Bacteroidales bacterium]|nr:hypothetical protein [Bacteroidales bacterium]